MTARRGTWTPWAQVLCAECDYTQLADSERTAQYSNRLASLARIDRTQQVECPDGDSLATCDGCGHQCWTRDDVAILQRVGLATSTLWLEGPLRWGLQQTGGMCSALVFSTDTRQIVVSAMDDTIVVGEYVKDEESSWDDPLRLWESAPIYDRVARMPDCDIESAINASARTVIEFLRASVATEHEAAVGARCREGEHGCCVACGVDMSHCNVCQGIGYHRENCSANEEET